MPTRPEKVRVGEIEYLRSWYVGRCWQPKVDPAAGTAAVAECTATETTAAVPFYRVVVGVTWTVAQAVDHGSCTAGACVYVATTLVSTGTDQVFDTKRPAPTVTPPGDQSDHAGVGTTLQLAATGGWLPRVWKASGLPPGLSLAAGTGVVSGTPGTPGSYTVTVMVTDRDGKTDDETFTWVVLPPPALTSPGDQTSRVGTAVSLALTVSGGRRPMSWTATGLPAGLALDAATGVITGTATAAATAFKPVTVGIVDANELTASVTFGWRVLTPVKVTDPGPQTFASGSTTTNFSVPVSGGLPPYTWQATGLPDGLTMSTAGQVTGTVANATRYVVTAVATDSAGGTGTIVVVCTVVPRLGELTVTGPLTDRTGTVGTAMASVTAGAAGGTASRTWSATGLPPGIAVSSAGVLSGTPATAGTYVSRLTVQDSTGKPARSMFTWTVTR